MLRFTRVFVLTAVATLGLLTPLTAVGRAEDHSTQAQYQEFYIFMRLSANDPWEKFGPYDNREDAAAFRAQGYQVVVR